MSFFLKNFTAIYLLRTLFIVLILHSVTIKAQDRQKADSLILLLENDKVYPLEDIIDIYLQIAKYGLPQEALEYAERALVLAEKYENDMLAARSWEHIGMAQRIMGNTLASFNASFEALKIYEKADMFSEQAATNAQIGIIYIDNKNFTEGIKYLSRSLKCFEKVKDTMKTAALYINLGEAYRLVDKLDSAELCFNKSLEINQHLNRDIIFAYATGNLGMIHAAEGKLELAKSELNKAQMMLEKLGDLYSVAVYKSEIGSILLLEGSIKRGELLLQESLQIAQNEQLKEQICDISKKLAVFYESENNLSNALVYRKQYEVYKDSLVNFEKIRKIEQLQGEYAIEKKETEIIFLNKINKTQKRVGACLGFGAMLLLVLAFLLYRLYKGSRKANAQLEQQKEVIKNREEEKALLLKELNNRVKNNLQMISSLLNLQSHQLKDHPAAESLIAGKFRVEALSLVHQKLYQDDYHTKIAINEYLEELALNLVHCFGKEVGLRLDLKEVEVKIDTAIPLGLVANELITNSLKYAFSNHDNPFLNVCVCENNSTLVISIADNGVGISKDQSKGSSSSFGLRLVHSLVNQLNAKLEYTNNKGSNWNIIVNNY